MTVIKEAKDIPTNNALFEYLNKNNIEYTFHTYFYKDCTVYKIDTGNEEHIKTIDKIIGVEYIKNN